MNYHVFVSHSSKDKDKAKWLAKDLEVQGYKVWYDTNEIEASEDWIDEIELGVDNSSVVVVVWTENAATSKWVQREIARADDKKKEIIPLRFDDTEISTILLQRTQHIDFRPGYFQSFQTLVSRLIRLLVDTEQPVAQSAGLAWQPKKLPFYRNRFLEENNYLDWKSPSFAINERTKLLINHDRVNAENFVTLVAIPLPEPIDVDFDDLLTKAELRDAAKVIRSKDASLPWQWFSLNDLNYQHTSRTDYMFYHPNHREEHNQTIRTWTFIRFHDEGGIEYSDSYASVYFSNRPERFQGYSFDLVTILGAAWKFSVLACNLYTLLGYQGKFQLLVNLRNTLSTTLAGFAIDQHGNFAWPNRVDKHMWHVEGSTQGIATEPNLQFVYDIDIKTMSSTPSLYQDMIVHLSHKLQRSFSWGVGDRHYIPNTNEFPWRQFERGNKI